MDPDAPDPHVLDLLLVEDVEPDGLLVEAMLREVRPATRVKRVGDAAAACRALASDPIDVVLLDLVLPDSQGTETIRRVAWSAGEIPIVVLTGSDEEQLGLACIEAGAQDYVPKSELRAPLLGRAIRYAVARAREAAARRRLEQEVLESSDRERQRIAHDLHDDLGQRLTGIALLGRSLAQQLAAQGSPAAEAADELSELVRGAVDQSMALARGLDPLTEHGEALPVAFEALARGSERMFPVRCRVRQRGSPPALSPSVAAHLYRIAQEAVTNAVKHGGAREIEIDLAFSSGGGVEIAISDDGGGLPPASALRRGHGLRIMEYRARAIGASLAVEPNPAGSGTRVRCRLA